VADPLVAIDEWMVVDQREARRRSPIHEAWVEIVAAKGLPRLGQGRLE
jgi:hypothetical protein